MQTSNQLSEKDDISSPPLTIRVECKAQPHGQQLLLAPNPTQNQPEYLQAASLPVVDYTLKVESVRCYQRELARPGINGDNYIICAPTGTGKTLVAGLIISSYLQKRQKLEKKVFFVVPTRPLAEQQAEELQRLIPGAKVVSSVGDDAGMTIKDVLPLNDIIVCTAGKLVNEIVKDRLVTFNDLGLLVLDECHHARKNAPHAKLMETYLERKKERGAAGLPQVIGLTASPGAGENPTLKEDKTIDHLISLCALMDATSGIMVVRENVAELHQFTTKPTITLRILNQRDPGEEFICLITDEMTKLEVQVDLKSPHKKWSQEYETCVQQKKLSLEVDPNPALRDCIRMLDLLRCYSQALSIYMDLRSKDAISILSDFTGLPADEQANDVEKQLKQSLENLIGKLARLPTVLNPLLQQAEDILLKQFTANPASKGILFVRTKKHASFMCDCISELSAASRWRIRPCTITGHSTKETGPGMSQDEQEKVMASFHKGECNLLVATSVAEEGLDVPACNLVIRFQHVTNEIARTQTQGRARATDSDCFTILSGETRKSYQEIKNGGLQALVEEVLQNRFPTGQIFQDLFRQRQQEIIRDHELMKSLKQQKQKTRPRSDVRLSCKKCKTFACCGSDIYTVENASHYVVPDEEFKLKIQIKPHPSPKKLSKTMEKTHKIYCVNCDADWGIMCVWPKEGHEFPVLKCVNFIFETSPGIRGAIKKWSDVPFEILPLSSYSLDSQ